MIPIEVLTKEVLFLRKSKGEFVLTNLKMFGPLSVIIIKNSVTVGQISDH